MNQKKLFWCYILGTFVFAWALQAAAILCGNRIAYAVILSFSMFAPLVVVLLLRQGKTIFWKPRLKGTVRWYLFAWFSPFVFTIVGAALYFLVFPQLFDGNFTTFKSQLPQDGSVPFTANQFLLLQIGAAVLTAPFINAVFALGEESGWRGFMTPYLCGRFGKLKGSIVSGVIWGVWHWPLIIFSGYEYGTGYPFAPFSGICVMCVFTVVLGIILQHCYEKTHCILVPSLLHGAINAVAGLPLLFLPPETTHYLLGPVPCGLLSLVPLAVCAAVFLFKKR